MLARGICDKTIYCFSTRAGTRKYDDKPKARIHTHEK
jgi:hypothetical protein